MKSKNYDSPDISVLNTESDIITSSMNDPVIGTETTPTDAGGGTWETL